jgi:hypothetical protein
MICKAKPPAGTDASPVPGGEKGLCAALGAEKSAEIGRLAAYAARSLGLDAGLEAAEAVIRAGMMRHAALTWPHQHPSGTLRQRLPGDRPRSVSIFVGISAQSRRSARAGSVLDALGMRVN